MRWTIAGAAICSVVILSSLTPAAASKIRSVSDGERGGGAPRKVIKVDTEEDDPIRVLVGQLDLERYKATIKGLTRFGDRRQGTDRNRAAIDWIESQLRSYGCSNISRLKYTFFPNEAPHP